MKRTILALLWGLLPVSLSGDGPPLGEGRNPPAAPAARRTEFIPFLSLLERNEFRSKHPDTEQQGKASNSSPILLDASRNRLYVVNLDSHSLSILDAATDRKIAEVPVGRNPRTVSLDARGSRIVVANLGDDSVSVLDAESLRPLGQVAVGDEPYGVVASPDDDEVFVACSGADALVVLDPYSLKVVARIPVEPNPRGLAISADGTRLYVTHFFSGRVSVVDCRERKVLATISTGRDSNMAQAIVIQPDGRRAYVPHIQSNVENEFRLFDTTVFPVVSVLDLNPAAPAEKKGSGVFGRDGPAGAPHQRLPTPFSHLRREKIGLDAADRPVNMPFAAACSPDGRLLYVVNAGSDDLSIIDLESRLGVGHCDVGANPRGIVLSPDGTKAYVANHVSNDVTVIDTRSRKALRSIRVTEDGRPADVKQGQALFFSSARPGLSQDRWMSCASCHFDGEIDGRTWKTERGPRNTQMLQNIRETPPLHWSGDRENVQAFQQTIRQEMGGSGLSPTQLDQLAAFVHTLRPSKSPHLTADGRLSEAALRGQAIFESAKTGCLSCHPPPLYTDRQKHDVGTGQGPAEKLGPAVDTPSLLSLYKTARYLHDGSATNLMDVLTTANPEDRHGATHHLTERELQDLVAFLQSPPFQ